MVWQDRQIVSEYGFISFTGDQETLHELRRVISVDTHPVADKKNEDSLARIISLKDDQREKELLKEFQKYGLVGAVTDFGPLLLMFTPREIEHFEFTLKGSQSLGATKALIFHYTQIDGAELFTIFENATPDKTKGDKTKGEKGKPDKDQGGTDQGGTDQTRRLKSPGRPVGAGRQLSAAADHAFGWGGAGAATVRGEAGSRLFAQRFRRPGALFNRSQGVDRRPVDGAELLYLRRFPQVRRRRRNSVFPQ